jgi:hypothetical protein
MCSMSPAAPHRTGWVHAWARHAAAQAAGHTCRKVSWLRLSPIAHALHSQQGQCILCQNSYSTSSSAALLSSSMCNSSQCLRLLK